MTLNTITQQEEIERIFLGFALEAQKQISLNFHQPKKKVIILAGPTGCGKSAFAIELAKVINGEVISADSMQVYKGMDIGTAKPSKEEREKTPHYLIDVRHIKENFNVVDFYYEARQSCQLVHNRGGVPLITGGSGFYIHSLLFGPPDGPPSVPEVRRALEEEMEKLGAVALFERLKHLDPHYAATITSHDKQKIIRGLEIITITKKRVSKLSWKGRKKTLNYDFRCWFLFRPREQLYKRIEERCEKMLADGFLEEVEYLLKNGILENSSASQAIGYRQALEFLQSSRDKEAYRHFLDSFKQASRRYAKKQFTWFRQEPLFRWLDLDLHDQEIAIDIIRKDYLESI